MKNRKLIELCVDDSKTVRTAVGRSRALLQGYLAGGEKMGGGFGQLVALLVADRMKELRAENDAMLRLSVLITDRVLFGEQTTEQFIGTDNRPDEQSKTLANDTCLFCFDWPIDIDKATLDPCGHCYACGECVAALVVDKCAICRASFAACGSADKVGQLFRAGVQVPIDIVQVKFVASSDKKNAYVDNCTLLYEQQDLRSALLDLHNNGGDSVPSHQDVATHAPSLFWSLYAQCVKAQKRSGDAGNARQAGLPADVDEADVSLEQRIDCMIHHLLDKPFTVKRARRRR